MGHLGALFPTLQRGTCGSSGLRSISWGFPIFCLWFQLPRCHRGTTFLSHSQLLRGGALCGCVFFTCVVGCFQDSLPWHKGVLPCGLLFCPTNSWKLWIWSARPEIGSFGVWGSFQFKGFQSAAVAHILPPRPTTRAPRVIEPKSFLAFTSTMGKPQVLAQRKPKKGCVCARGCIYNFICLHVNIA